MLRDTVTGLAAIDTGTIDENHMRRMNLAVDQQGESPVSVAETLLRDLRDRRREP